MPSRCLSSLPHAELDTGCRADAGGREVQHSAIESTHLIHTSPSAISFKSRQIGHGGEAGAFVQRPRFR